MYIQDIGSVAPVFLKQSRYTDPQSPVAWPAIEVQDLGASGMACRG